VTLSYHPCGAAEAAKEREAGVTAVEVRAERTSKRANIGNANATDSIIQDQSITRNIKNPIRARAVGGEEKQKSSYAQQTHSGLPFEVYCQAAEAGLLSFYSQSQIITMVYVTITRCARAPRGVFS